jgi:hypothetical protein
MAGTLILAVARTSSARPTASAHREDIFSIFPPRSRYLFRAALLDQGASSGDVRKMEQVRRPRVRLVTSHSGGFGAPPGRHYDRSARSSLDWDWAQMPSSQEARPGAEPRELSGRGESRSGAPGGAPPRSQEEAARLASVPGQLRRLSRGPRKPPRFSALRSPWRGALGPVRRPSKQAERTKAQPARQDKRAAERWLLHPDILLHRNIFLAFRAPRL